MDSKSFIEVHNFFSQLGVEKKVIASAQSNFKLMVFHASEVLLRQEEEQRYGYLILSGILRACHYFDNGGERCKEYYFAGELCFLYSCWLTNTSANYQIEALKDAVVIRVPLLLLDSPLWRHAQTGLLKQQLLYKEAKEVFLLLKSPEDRYLHLLEHAPKWVTNLNNIHLANYIGISPISLSRIKSRIDNSIVLA